MGKSSIFGFLQKIGKALMLPVAVLPAAGLLLRLGQPDVFNIPFVAAAGDAIFANLALLFAIGVAIGLADDNNGAAGLAGAVGYFVLTKGVATINEKNNMAVLAGIIAGAVAGLLYNKFKNTKLPDFLEFFGGKRFVPIVTAATMIVLAGIFGYIWPSIQAAINGIANWIIGAGAVGVFVFGFLNRLLIPLGLHHILNSFLWFVFGEYPKADGTMATGDLNRFFAGDPTAGGFMAGFYPIMMFALPAACFAIITMAKKENRTAITGAMLSVAFTSFLTGITEPIEFTFMFLAPILYVFHALLTEASMAVAYILGIKHGFTFSAGAIDYFLNMGLATNGWTLIPVGLIFGVAYYLVFVWAIKAFNLPTPGRIDETEDTTGGATDLREIAEAYINKLGGADNIDGVDSCITRLRMTLKDTTKVNDKELIQLGASGVLRPNKNNLQVVVGTKAELIADQIKKILGEKPNLTL